MFKTTSLKLYAFGLGELLYQGDGTNVGGASNCFYYSVGGLVLGKTDGTNTTFFLSDGLGSVVASFSNTANSAAVLGNQTYEPYGKAQYQQGSLGTSRGYTGQYTDNLSGLDYYNARYYDPVAGLFLSADSVQGNAQGMDPYAYVAGNPESRTDPTGQRICDNDGNCKGGRDKGIGGSPNPDKDSGGCNAGMHPRPGDGMCVQNGSNCPAGMLLGKGGCDYTSGECKGLTEKGCNQFKQNQRIRRAQAVAQQEAIKLFFIASMMLLLISDLPGWVARLQQLSAYFATLAAVDVWNVVGTVVFGALSIAAAGVAVFLAGSMVTLVLGAIADARLAAVFEQQATDSDPANWTSSAISRFRYQVEGFTDIVNAASTTLSVLTGNGLIAKLIGALEPTTNILYDFDGISDALNQMTAEMSA
ncbi:MAG TPA: RHS repeat-associated core domain-containing protein [Ktedonobacteraceae bacterium]|nr:RHS repeat-associated core domain-containing protein [Ktedonobacteraceae bacterium]